MKSFQAHMCEKCGQVYTDKSVALECEKEHVDIKQLKIVSAEYNTRQDIIKDEKGVLKRNATIPQRINIKFHDKDKTNFFENSFTAIYELKNFNYDTYRE